MSALLAIAFTKFSRREKTEADNVAGRNTLFSKPRRTKGTNQQPYVYTLLLGAMTMFISWSGAFTAHSTMIIAFCQVINVMRFNITIDMNNKLDIIIEVQLESSVRTLSALLAIAFTKFSRREKTEADNVAGRNTLFSKQQSFRKLISYHV